MAGRHWTDHIRDITTRDEYQTAVIELRNPTLQTRTVDIAAGVMGVAGDPVVWSGRARIVSVRRAVDSNKGNLSNPTGQKPIAVQIPGDTQDGYSGRIERGWQVRVRSVRGDTEHSLTESLIVVESGFEPSNAAARTIECQVDVETKPVWA